MVVIGLPSSLDSSGSRTTESNNTDHSMFGELAHAVEGPHRREIRSLSRNQN